jgi:metal-sulfur cluster biosynthetic enzyme
MNPKPTLPSDQAILTRLREVIDPETHMDVVSMRLVENLTIDADGTVSYTFRPSSPFCPLAVPLAIHIKSAVAEVPGVINQKIKIEGYCEAEQLTSLINQEV